MDKYYTQMRVGYWTDWIGQPMLYDGGLFVNRTLEELLASKALKRR